MGSDAYDVASANVIRLADLFAQVGQLPAATAQALLAGISERDVRGIKATRNVLAHDYANMDDTVFRRTVTRDVPRLLATLRENVDAYAEP